MGYANARKDCALYVTCFACPARGSCDFVGYDELGADFDSIGVCPDCSCECAMIAGCGEAVLPLEIGFATLETCAGTNLEQELAQARCASSPTDQ
mmetsp:Transcript_70350/g.187378  ORF Transcript_70350/g.187378 Transcript_70350/m.187378 type:complete len:95 (-) Transcript_70350:117-401(-)